MFSNLEETSIVYIVLTEWMPSIITILFGGYMASILFPRMQDNFQKSQQREERKQKIAEEIIQTFGRYITSWRRLIQISQLELERNLSDVELNRKHEFIDDRKEQRDKLVDQLRLCQLYYSNSTCDHLNQFLEWDEGQASKRLDDLPSIEEWRRYEEHLIKRIKSDLGS